MHDCLGGKCWPYGELRTIQLWFDEHVEWIWRLAERWKHNSSRRRLQNWRWKFVCENNCCAKLCFDRRKFGRRLSKNFFEEYFLQNGWGRHCCWKNSRNKQADCQQRPKTWRLRRSCKSRIWRISHFSICKRRRCCKRLWILFQFERCFWCRLWLCCFCRRNNSNRSYFQL